MSTIYFLSFNKKNKRRGCNFMRINISAYIHRRVPRTYPLRQLNQLIKKLQKQNIKLMWLIKYEQPGDIIVDCFRWTVGFDIFLVFYFILFLLFLTKQGGKATKTKWIMESKWNWETLPKKKDDRKNKTHKDIKRPLLLH